jgi:Flp pilus assembly protein TadG
MRLRRDDGAALVEFALVLPVLTMLLLGMVSGAVAWNENLALSQGARVAARQAVTLPLPASQTASTMAVWLDAVADTAVASAEGTVDGSISSRAVCVAFVYPAGSAPDQTYSRMLSGPGSGTRTSGTSPCFDDGQGDAERRLQIVLSRDGVLDIGIQRMTLTLRRQVVYRYEAHGGL